MCQTQILSNFFWSTHSIMNPQEVSGNGPHTQLLEQFCEITASEHSVITGSIRICTLCFLPTLRCIAKDTQLNYVKNLLSEQNPQKLSPDDLVFREFLMNFLAERPIRSQERSFQEEVPFSPQVSFLQESLMIQKPLKFSPTSMISKKSTSVACEEAEFFV